MTKVYVFLAEGFEELEALTVVDVLRRGGVQVDIVSITGDLTVSSSHGVNIVADKLLAEIDGSDADLLVLPGGMPGSENLKVSKPLCDMLTTHCQSGKLTAAICAAPMVLGHLGLLKGKKATCYPGFEKYLNGADYTAQLCTVDGHIITGAGPAASFPFAYALLQLLTDERLTKEVMAGMRYDALMKQK